MSCRKSCDYEPLKLCFAQYLQIYIIIELLDLFFNPVLFLYTRIKIIKQSIVKHKYIIFLIIPLYYNLLKIVNFSEILLYGILNKLVQFS